MKKEGAHMEIKNTGAQRIEATRQVKTPSHAVVKTGNDLRVKNGK